MSLSAYPGAAPLFLAATSTGTVALFSDQTALPLRTWICHEDIVHVQWRLDSLHEFLVIHRNGAVASISMLDTSDDTTTWWSVEMPAEADVVTCASLSTAAEGGTRTCVLLIGTSAGTVQAQPLEARYEQGAEYVSRAITDLMQS
jgi:hypothetical protein